MSLDQGRKQQAEAWLQDRCPSMTCPACAGVVWAASAAVDVSAPSVLAGVGQPDFPMVAVVCQGCGLVRFFSAEKMGLTF